MQQRVVQAEVIIAGGGVAGLWLLNRLKQLGYSALLFNDGPVGGGQTICSQGIIHSGVKYALTGRLTKSSQAIQAMPDVWRDCLHGQGEVDLSSVKILTETQLMWSVGSLGADIAAFLASKSLKSRVKKIDRAQLPVPFSHDEFNGIVYQLSEPALDVPSLVRALAEPCLDGIYQYDSDKACWDKEGVFFPEINTRVLAKKIVLLAGAGNASLMQQMKMKLCRQQSRPLHMSYLKAVGLPMLYAHCMQTSTKPRVTITSYQHDGEVVWYLGGDLAETGVKRNTQQQNAFVRGELASLFPWLDLSKATVNSFMVDRVEAKQGFGRRPDEPSVFHKDALVVGWPTKLAFAPLLASRVIELLPQPTGVLGDCEALSSLSCVEFSKPVWG